MFFSANISGVHALPNGNLFACVGSSGYFFEVTLDGQVVWEYVNPIGANIGPLEQGGTPQQNYMFRSTKYPANYAAFEGKDLTPGDPVELNPLPSDCVIYDTPVATEHEILSSGIKLLGNPVSDQLSILNEINELLYLEVFDLKGSPMITLKSSDNLITLPEYDRSDGIYLLRVSNQHQVTFSTKKIVKH
jgi:hypothetical protein